METIKFKGLTAEERLNLDMPEDLFQEMKEDPKVKEYLELEKNKKSNSRSVELYLYIIKKYVDKTKGLTEVNLLLEEVTLIPERLIFLINLRKLTLKKLIEKF